MYLVITEQINTKAWILFIALTNICVLPSYFRRVRKSYDPTISVAYSHNGLFLNHISKPPCLGCSLSHCLYPRIQNDKTKPIKDIAYRVAKNIKDYGEL